MNSNAKVDHSSRGTQSIAHCSFAAARSILSGMQIVIFIECSQDTLTVSADSYLLPPPTLWYAEVCFLFSGSASQLSGFFIIPFLSSCDV